MRQDPIVWREQQKEAFEKHKTTVCKGSTLAHLDPKRGYFLDTNVTGTEVDAALSQNVYAKNRDLVGRSVYFQNRIL